MGTQSLIDVWMVGRRTRTSVPDARFPSHLSTWNQSGLNMGDDGTHYGFVGSGDVSLECSVGAFSLRAGMYFAVPGEFCLRGSGYGFVATRVDQLGFFQIGGPAERLGRLAYIDGCSDSLLISPPVLGDPCLNLLYLPPALNKRSIRTQVVGSV